MTKPLQFEYDAATDILTVEGIQYDGQVFREFGFGGMMNQTIQFRRDDRGAISLQKVDPPYREIPGHEMGM
jgi:hypothetical protein